MILIDSRKATVYAILGNVLSFVIVAMLGGNVNDINQDLFGYN
ncbi:urea transporter, partial [Staphylococcus warneri]